MKQPFQIPEEIEALIADFLRNRINEEGVNTLSNWLQEDNSRREYFNEIKSAWLLSNKNLRASSEEIDAAIQKINQLKDQSKIVEMKPYWNFTRIAVSWVVLLGIGGLLGTYFGQKNSNNTQLTGTTITAPLGSKSVVTLPDGTKVWINAGSKIYYDNEFGKGSREVQLIGEAYFNVKTNKKVPFLVKTSDIIVKALGTKFNVKAYPEEKTITTTLEEGKVVLTSLKKQSTEEAAELKPNQTLVYYRDVKKSEIYDNLPEKQAEKEVASYANAKKATSVDWHMPTELITSWKDDVWIIEGEPLGILAPVLERRYNVKIEFQGEEIKEFKFTGKIQKETIEQIMEAMELSSPIHCMFDNNTLKISLNSKLFEKYKRNTSK